MNSYNLFQHRQLALRLHQVQKSGKLGSGPSEHPPQNIFSIPHVLFHSIPYKLLISQTLWSIFVIVVAHLLSPDEPTSLSTEYWTSHLIVSSSVSNGIGWALFILLGFFIREASNRYWQAYLHWTNMTAYLRQIVRHMRQSIPPGTWHHGDHDRVTAHLMAYPISLKMTLRGEREREQLHDILDKQDLDELLNSQEMHIHCMRVVRAYFSAVEDDAPISFACIDAEKTPCGNNTRFFFIKFIDAVDDAANAIIRISHFKPAKGYVNHLCIFLYIWLLFLPLALVQTSGWFTIIWALLVSYGIGMLFNIAQALNDPFGYDIQDIKLNHIAAESALEILNAYCCDQTDLTAVIRKDHNTPHWLNAKLTDPTKDMEEPTSQIKFKSFLTSLWSFFTDTKMILSLLIYILWSLFVVFISWHFSKPNPDGECRWWCGYIPVDRSTTSYVSLGISLLLSFWISDAYRRYWRGLQLWQNAIRTAIEEIALQVAFVAKQGSWHDRDRERFFSHLVALPYAAKIQLRRTRDTSDLENILDAQDVAAFRQANDIFVHATNVVYGYLNSIDRVHPETTRITKNPFRVSMRGTMKMMWNVEQAIQECEAIVKYPISPSFTIHLKVFTAFWLALLPLSLVPFNGFLSFFYIVPFGYSIMKLIKVGVELADPFGWDKDDIPLDTFCHEIKASLHSIYNETLGGTPAYVHESDYVRTLFAQNITGEIVRDEKGSARKAGTKGLSRKPSIALDHHTNTTIVTFLRNIIASFPSVSVWAMIAATMWSVITVCASYALSFLWDDKKRDACNWWCSPIDVEGAALTNIGFVLFMILTFRAADAIDRYQDGTLLMIELEKELHHLAVELLVFFKNKLFHEKDKERIVAHIVQIPLCFRDCLLNIVRTNSDEKEGLLSAEDRHHFETSTFPIHHLLQTVQAYVVLHDSLVREGHPNMPEFRVPPPITYGIMLRIARIRGMIFQAFAVKRFPVVGGYTRHQRIFAVLWLMLLPLTLTQFSGFFAILWTPIISYGVLALEEIAVKLVDPYGTDAIDIDVDEMCLHAANSVLEAVDNIKWGCEPNVCASPVVTNPSIRMDVEGQEINQRYTLAHFEEFEKSVEFGEGQGLEFTGPIESRMKPNLFTHMIRSVPWSKLIAVTVWTVIATSISFLTKDASKTARWWESGISLDVPVATYISFTAFMLLGFYGQAAFSRYNSAGRVWTHDLRFACSSLAAEFLALFPAGTLHEEDHQRVVAHIAALPLVLKHELRHSRDTRELKGLLSHEDMVRIQCANSMADHCVDVIRSYYAGGTTHKNLFTKEVVLGNRMSFIKLSVAHLENGIALSKFLRSYEIAPGFLILLNLLLGTWFLLLPFVFAEKSGWFTILWVLIIAYGVLGVYSIARELQFPFGNDLNDLDLDEMAKTIVSDVLFVQKHYQHGTDALVRSSETQPYWEKKEPSLHITEKQKYSKRKRIGQIYRSFISSLKLTWNTFSPLLLVLLLAWTSLCILIAWLIRRHFPFDKGTEDGCGPWFCSRVAIDDSAKEFIGYALFFLIGFRLYDSHRRYVSALEIWEEGILGHTRVLANRIMESFYGNEWHEGDRERIAGHLAAHAVAVAARLREEDYEGKFREILSEEDTKQLLKTRQPSDYCLDVIHRYMTESDWMYGKDKMHAVSKNESRIIFFNLAQLRRVALQCENMIRIPLPYGYIQHLRILLVIWFFLLPLGMVEATGWLTIFWILFIAYGVIGIEKWAKELANPFGYDISDIPMDEMVEKVKDVVRINLWMFRNGVKDFIRHDRSAFPVCQVKDEEHLDEQDNEC